MRLLIFDRTCTGRFPSPGLTEAWWAGSWLYRGLGRVDLCFGAASWEEALDWICATNPSEAISEIQFWGHGHWGCVLIANDVLDASALREDHPLYARLAKVKARMSLQSLWWFRTCETFGKVEGQAFAKAWVDFFQCRAAGHTYVIGAIQSGLQVLGPFQKPSWSVLEGLPIGSRDPEKALSSSFGAPNTITCFHGSIPSTF